MTPNLSSNYHFRKTGSGQFLQPGQIYLSLGLAKTCAMLSCTRDKFPAKEPGQEVGWAALPTLSPYTSEAALFETHLIEP
jgi:hypothetical protein